MYKLITLFCCLALCAHSISSSCSGSGCSGSMSGSSSSSGCSSGSCGSSSSSGCSSDCGSGSSSSSSSDCSGCVSSSIHMYGSNSSGSEDLEYETIPMPSDVQIGIMDAPFYDPDTRSLYFVNLFTRDVLRYSEDDDQVYRGLAPESFTAGFFIPTSVPGVFYAGFGNSTYVAKWDGKSSDITIVKKLFTVPYGDNTPNMNWLIAGPKTTLFTGTVDLTLLSGDANTQRFYRYSPRSGLKTLPGRFKTTNSLLYDYKHSILYHNDGCTQELLAYKLDRCGNIRRKWIVLKTYGFQEFSAAPVGLAQLTTGEILVSSYKAGKLFKVNPRTKSATVIAQFPTELTAAAVFGGSAMNRLYVMTAALSANLETGQSDGITPAEPAGQLLMYKKGFGTGRRVKKPIVRPLIEIEFDNLNTII